MKTLVLLLVALPLIGSAQTQSEMNAEAAADFEKADRRLNAVYVELRKSLDDEGREKLKLTQRAWIAFRDAEAEFVADDEARGGSIFPLIFFEAKTKLTEARIEELKKFLVPYEDR